MPFPKIHDWESIRLDYIVGEIIIDNNGLERHRPFTMKRLAEKHGISVNTLTDKAHREKWNQQRTLLDSKLRRKMSEGKVTAILSESTMFDNLALAQLAKTSQMVNAYFNQYPQAFNQDIPNNENGYSEIYTESETPRISPRDLKDIVGVIKEVHLLHKSIIGTETLQNQLEEIQNKNKTKQLKPSEMNDRIKKLLEERQRIEQNMSQEKRAVEEVNVFNAKTITKIES